MAEKDDGITMIDEQISSLSNYLTIFAAGALALTMNSLVMVNLIEGQSVSTRPAQMFGGALISLVLHRVLPPLVHRFLKHYKKRLFDRNLWPKNRFHFVVFDWTAAMYSVMFLGLAALLLVVGVIEAIEMVGPQEVGPERSRGLVSPADF